MKQRIVCISIWYNREELVDESVASIASQMTENDLLILVDDNSSDSTFEKLKKWQSDNVQVKTQNNKGFVTTIADELSNLDCKYVAIHGSGDISLNGRIEEQAKQLEDHKNVVAVGCRIRRVDLSSEVPKITEHGQPGIYSYSQKIVNHNPFTHGEVMFRYEKYLAAGGYRTFFTYAQDRDLWCRLSTQGDFCIVNKVLYERKVGVKGAVSGTFKNALIQRYLSGFAIFCHQFKLKHGYDPLEKYGHHASLMYRGSANLNKDLSSKYIECISNNNHELAQLYEVAFNNENPTLLERGIKILKRLRLKILSFKGV